MALDGALLAGAKLPEDKRAAAAKIAFDNSRSSSDPAAVTSFWTDPVTLIFHGTATSKLPTTFLKVVGREGIDVSVRSGVRPPQASNPICVLLLEKSGPALTLKSNAAIEAPTCNIDVRSNSASAVTLQSGAYVNAKRTCAAGGFALSSTSSRASYKSSCDPITDPFAGKLPVPPPDGTCTYRHKTFSGGNNTVMTLDPGTICDGMTFSSPGIATFAPGLYRVRRGAIKFNTSVTVIAHGVTFYFEDAQSFIEMNSSSSLSLNPPTSGTYAGISMYEAPGLSPSTMSIKAASNGSMEGLFYLPSKTVQLNSSSALNSRKLTLVASAMELGSSSNWNIDRAEDETKRIYRNEIAFAE